jgi:hypothetical protein
VVSARQAAFRCAGQPVDFVFSGPNGSIYHTTFALSACLNRPVWIAWRRLCDVNTPITPRRPTASDTGHPQLIFFCRLSDMAI